MMDAQQRDELLAIYEGMARKQLVENSLLAAQAAEHAEELIEELREQLDTPVA